MTGHKLIGMDLTDLTHRWEKTLERQIANQAFYFTFSRNSKHFAVSELNDVLILDNKTGDCLQRFSHPGPVTESAISETKSEEPTANIYAQLMPRAQADATE
jgi:hypothetical protein